MGSKRRVETSPALAFIKQGILNTIVYHGKEGIEAISTADAAFLEDERIVRSANMDHVNFRGTCVFKVTLDFVEPMECVEATAVRESTDWVLCSCSGTHAIYSKVDQRLVLQQCKVSTMSTVEELSMPFVIYLLLDDDEWVVERILL